MQIIENEIVPYLLEKYQYYDALFFIEILEGFYLKNKTKSSEIAVLIGSIHIKMLREKV